MQSMSMVELVHCMTYWIVFSVLTLFEQLFDGLIGDVLPFYYEFKIIFLIWLVSPITRGSSFIFTRIIHPLMVRVEVGAEKVVEKIRQNRTLICKTCKSTLVSLFRLSSAAAKNMISSVLQTAIAGGAGLQDYEVSKEKDGQEEESEEGDCERHEVQEEFQFSRLTDQKVKSVRGRRKTLTGTTIMLAQPANKVNHVVMRGGGKKIEPEYKETFPHKPEQSSIIQKKSRKGSNQKKISIRSDSKLN